VSIETDAEIVATCEAAATYLAKHGLARGAYAIHTKAACTAGALVIAHSGNVTAAWNSSAIERTLAACPAIPAVIETIRALHPARLAGTSVSETDSETDPVWIYKFNDHPDTTQDDVIEVLRETIKRHTPDEYRPTPQETP
jgi:hypothetical protein